MCLAIPGRLIRIVEGAGLERRGTLEIAGAIREVNLAMVPEAAVGDYVLTHSGFAIRIAAPPDHREAVTDRA